MFVARFGIDFRTKLFVPRAKRSSLVVVGVFMSIMTSVGSSPIQMPLDDKRGQDSELPLVQNRFWTTSMSSLLLEVLETYPLVI